MSCHLHYFSSKTFGEMYGKGEMLVVKTNVVGPVINIRIFVISFPDVTANLPFFFVKKWEKNISR